jgi:hypothetical protein
MSGIILCFAVYLLLLLIFPCEPPDDLLRHMVSYTYEYDHHQMWPFSPGVPDWNMYYLFDVFAGYVHSIIGNNGYLFIQALVSSLYFGGIWWLLKGASSRNWKFALTMIILAVLFNRMHLGRPSVFESGFFLIALAACKEEYVPWWAHFLLGCLMASFYHLFFIYLIPLVMYRRVYLLSLAAGFIGWFAYAGVDFFYNIIRLMTIQSQRGGIKISEAAPLPEAMFPMMYLLLPVLFFWRKDIKQLLVVGWFFLSNQVRYLEVIAPLMLSYAKHWNVKISQTALIIVFISASCFRSFTHSSESWKIFAGVVPAGSSVLCLEYAPMFKLAFTGTHIRLSPCMDVGWDTNEVKRALLVASKEGTFDLAAFKPGTYDYVVESNLKNVPKGMELYKVAGKWRIWRPLARSIHANISGGSS